MSYQPIYMPGLGVFLGGVRNQPLGGIASSAAQKIARDWDGQLMAVTLDDRGYAYLELPADVADEDAVGYYQGTLPFTLERAILEDLKHEVQLRGLRP